jgi:hypothetical protein
MRFGMGRGARGCCGRASLLSGTSLGRGHPQPEAPPSRSALTGLRAPALGPGGLELRRGLGGQSGADPGSRLPAPCDGVRGPRGAGRSPAEVSRCCAGAGSRAGGGLCLRLGSGEPLIRGEPQGSPRPTLLANCTPRSSGILWASRVGDGATLPRPRTPPLQSRGQDRMLDPRVQRQKMGSGAEPLTRHSGVPCSRHLEKPQSELRVRPSPSAQSSASAGPALELSLGFWAATSPAESAAPHQAWPLRAELDVWRTHRLQGDPPGRPFQAPPCKQTLQDSPLPRLLLLPARRVASLIPQSPHL